MKDLTRTPTLSPRSDATEIQRWINKIAVRGNFDWMPGVAGYSTTLLQTAPFTLAATYDDLIKFSFTPRVKCRLVVLAQLSFDCTVVTPLVKFGCYTSPTALASSLTNITTPTDYSLVACPTVSGRVTRTVVNSFDLAAGCAYEIRARGQNAGTGTARFRDPSMIIGVHFPLLTPAGQ